MVAGRVEGLHRTAARRGDLEPLLEAVVVTNRGIEGDHHGRPGSSRQVVLVEAEVLDDLDLKRGDIREQLCVRGLTALRAGDVLEIGDVRLEVVKPRVPCQLMDTVRRGLRIQLEGRAGWCARATAGGTIRVGDSVTVGRVDDPAWLHDFRHALATYEAAPRAGRDDAAMRAALIHMVEWNEQCVAQLGEPTSQAIRPTNPGPTLSEMYRLHDLSATAVVDGARAVGEPAAAPVGALAAHYRKHATEWD